MIICHGQLCIGQDGRGPFGVVHPHNLENRIGRAAQGRDSHHKNVRIYLQVDPMAVAE